MGYCFKLPCCCFSDGTVPQRLRVGSPTLFLIHPLRLIICARVTDYREIHNLASDRRVWANTSDLLAKLLRTRYPRTLKIGSVPSAQSESENVHLEQSGSEDFKIDFSGY